MRFIWLVEVTIDLLRGFLDSFIVRVMCVPVFVDIYIWSCSNPYRQHAGGSSTMQGFPILRLVWFLRDLLFQYALIVSLRVFFLGGVFLGGTFYLLFI